MADAKSLQAALGILERNLSQMKQQIDGFDANLVTARNDLEIPLDVAGKLQSLSNTLSTTSQLLSVISIVPEIGTEADVLKGAVDTLARPVASASSAANRFANVIRPLRDRVAQLEVRVHQLDQALGESIHFEQQADSALGQAQSCINALPTGGVKQGLLNQLDSVCSTAQPGVEQTNSILAKVNGEFATLQNDLNQAKHRLQQLAGISNAINAVMSKLHSILVPMQKVANALSNQITVPIGPPIPHKVCFKWGFPYPCNWYPPSLSFSIQQILKGVSGVLAPVIRLLNSATKAILSPLLSALHLNITLPQIPGIGDLANELQNLVDSLGDLQDRIGQFFTDLTALENQAKGIAGTSTQLQAVHNACRSSHQHYCVCARRSLGEEDSMR